MFGSASFADLPFAALPGPSARLYGSADLLVLVQRASAVLRGALRLVASADNRLFAATEDYISRPGDRTSNRLFSGTVQQAMRLSRSIVGSDDFGAYTLGLGETVLTNADGAYDGLIGAYAIDGRPIVIRLGDALAPYDTFGTVFSGRSTGWTVNGTELIVELRDNGYLLEVAASPATFAGTGGIEGGEDLKGRRKPRPLGIVRNVTPAVLTSNTSLVHAVGDGIHPLHGIPTVYVRGNPLVKGSDFPTFEALVASTVAGGGYNTCLAKGLFRPAFTTDQDRGQYTADVEGELAADGSWPTTTAAIVAHLAAGTAGVATLAAESFTTVNALQPAAVGFYLGAGDETTLAQVIVRLMAGISGWAGFRRAGDLEVGILRAPVGEPVERWTDIEILTIDREALPSAVDPPPYRQRAIYARNWTIQGDSLAGSVSQARRAMLAAEYQVTDAAEDGRIRINHPLAQDPAPIESYFDLAAPTKAEAERRLALHRGPHSLYRAKLRTAPFRLELGAVVQVTYPRWDLPAGKRLTVVAVDEDTENNIVEITGWG